MTFPLSVEGKLSGYLQKSIILICINLPKYRLFFFLFIESFKSWKKIFKHNVGPTKWSARILVAC